MKKTGKYYFFYSCLALLVMVILSGCGKLPVSVTIVDGKTETRMNIEAGMTVEEVLQRAEIMINEQDIVTPQKDTEITEQEQKISISRFAKVKVIEGDTVTEVEETGKTVQDVLVALHLNVGEYDYLNHDKNAYLENGMELHLIHRLPVKLDVDGEERDFLTKAYTVEELLAEQHIAVGEQDRVNPKKDTVLTEGAKVKVERVSVKEVKEKEAIPFGTKIEYSNTMYSDQSIEKTPGIEGEKEVTYQVIYVDGKEESRKAVDEKVLKEPVDQVITQGTKQRRRIVSKQKVPDCDGSGHGYYIITWSDGTVEYEDY